MYSLHFTLDIRRLLESNYTALDFLMLIKKHREAQEMLCNWGDREAVKLLLTTDDDALERAIEDYYSSDKEFPYPLENLIIADKECLRDPNDYNPPLTDMARIVEYENEEEPRKPHEFIEGFVKLIDFKYGIPGVCNVKIGDIIDDDRRWHLISGTTGDSLIDEAIGTYDASIGCEQDEDKSIKSIGISMYFHDWSLDDLKALFDYLSKSFPCDKKNAIYDFDENNNLSAVNMLLSNSLFKITVASEHDTEVESDFLNIDISREKNDPKLYQALNTLAVADNIDPFVCSTLEEIIKASSQAHPHQT